VSASFKIVGHDELIKKLVRLPGAALEASAVGQFNAAQNTMAISKQRAPFEHGDLEKAAFVQFPKITAFAASVEMGYSGVAYTETQHEGDWQHPGSKTTTSNMARASQGQKKFLETAVQDTEGDTVRMIAAAVDFFLRTGRLPKMTGSIGGKQ